MSVARREERGCDHARGYRAATVGVKDAEQQPATRTSLAALGRWIELVTTSLFPAVG